MKKRSPLALCVSRCCTDPRRTLSMPSLRRHAAVIPLRNKIFCTLAFAARSFSPFVPLMAYHIEKKLHKKSIKGVFYPGGWRVAVAAAMLLILQRACDFPCDHASRAVKKGTCNHMHSHSVRGCNDCAQSGKVFVSLQIQVQFYDSPCFGGSYGWSPNVKSGYRVWLPAC